MRKSSVVALLVGLVLSDLAVALPHHQKRDDTYETTVTVSTTVTVAAVPFSTTSAASSVSTSAATIASSSSVAGTNSNIIASTSTSSTAPSSTPSNVARTNSSTPSILRGVNLGGWLVLEKWMNWDTFTGDFANANDQWTFDSIPGAADALKKHWDTYFTEDDIKKIAATGINALRIPIGFWAYDNAGTPYIQGADAYLEKAIGWARNAGLKVWVDCHGSPGSQNGFDNSGHAGAVEWQQADNLARSTAVLQTMGKKYGSMDYADVVVGLEMVNEPISWGANNIEVTKVWARDTFNAVKSVVANPDLVIVMHDAFYSAPAWVDFANGLNANRKFGIDTHLYQIFTDADNQMTQPQHIEKACNWANELGTANNAAPTYVGEFSAASNICVNPDGTTTPGWSCSVDGCQCQAGDWNMWGPELIEQTRRFVEAELDAFERASSGWFMWAAKGPGGWGFLNGIEKGIIPNPVTSRLYPNQCGYPSPSA